MSVTLNNIVMDYSGNLALDDVSVTFGFNEVHGLIGENGAGKSTLINVLSGTVSPTSGDIYINDSLVKLGTPCDALLHGIAQVSQEGSLVPQLSGAENIMLGAEPKYLGSIIRRKDLLYRAERLLNKWFPEASISLDRSVETLGVADQKVIEIVRALRGNIKILILDEPTAALQSREKEQLWKIISSLPQKGVGVVLISHFLSEIKLLSNKVTVLRDGKFIDTLQVENTTEGNLIDLMLRRTGATKGSGEVKNRSFVGGKTVLSVKNWKAGQVSVPQFEVMAGEIVGLIGLTGAGHFGFVRSLYSKEGLISGTVEVEGKPVAGNVRAMQRSGVAFVPDHRMENSLMPDGSVTENLSLVHPDFAARSGILNFGVEKAEVVRIIDLLNIKTSSRGQLLRNLSGGNKQKVSLGKWLYGAENKYCVMIFIEPTEGVDIGAKQEIYRKIRALAKQGMGIIIASSDLLEIEHIAQRVVPFVNGFPSKEIFAEDFSEKRFISALSGENA
ncbi:MAG: sugar ABC transporter ATP-binding protein [Devosiaceae bacterium]|nr:sugar ABC transporter ATP-binding protein [Devosiaceae bacterium]